MTTSGTVSTTINATPEAVWPLLAHIERHGEWSPKSFNAECVSGASGEVGARYRSVGWVPGDKHHSNEVEIVESVPGKRLVLHCADPQGTFVNSYDLTAGDGGTQVTHTLTFPELKAIPRMAVKVLFPLVGVPDMKKRIALLKEKVEGGA